MRDKKMTMLFVFAGWLLFPASRLSGQSALDGKAESGVGALNKAVPSALSSKNFIDEYIFAKMARDGVPNAPLSSDTEFLRRVTLDLTGRPPTPGAIRAFVADPDLNKRDKWIDSLFPKLPTMGIGRRDTRTGPYLDRWTNFFMNMFRVNQHLLEGINTFHGYVFKVLELNVPYDAFVRDMLTSSAVSSWTTGPANFIARHRVLAGDGYSEVNHEDTADELAIWTSKLFLGINVECISCHDGARHLEKVNLWLARHKRADIWRQAAFFGKTFVAPAYGRIPEFVVNESAKGYDLSTKSVTRLPRYKADITPTFLLTGERYDPASRESERQFYARTLTSHPQFARATVNLFWAELMGRGIVDPPLGFDLDRQDPTNPPPAPWTLQPTHPELLNALADDFRRNGYDLRRLMKLIVQSNAYQLSSNFPGPWKPEFDDYFARHQPRRLSALEFWDAVSEATGIFETFQVKFDDNKFSYLMQSHFNHDYESQTSLWNLLQDFGETDREDQPTREPSMLQAASLLNHELIRDRVKIRPGSRLEKILRATPAKTNKEITEELFLATVGHFPNTKEERLAVGILERSREQGAEDLLWALLNRVDFVVVR